MTDPTPDPLAEALTAVLHDYYTVLPKLYVDVAHRIVTTTLAARGVYLVTEESLARAMAEIARAKGSKYVYPRDAADILCSLGEASDD